MNNNLNFVDLSNGKCSIYLGREVYNFDNFKVNIDDQWFCFVHKESEKKKELNIWKDFSKGDGDFSYKASIHDVNEETGKADYVNLKYIPVVTTNSLLKEDDLCDMQDEEIEDVIETFTIPDCFYDSLVEYIKKHNKLIYRNAMVEFLTSLGEEIISKEEVDVYIASKRKEQRIAELEKELAELKNSL